MKKNIALGLVSGCAIFLVWCAAATVWPERDGWTPGPSEPLGDEGRSGRDDADYVQVPGRRLRAGAEAIEPKEAAHCPPMPWETCAAAAFDEEGFRACISSAISTTTTTLSGVSLGEWICTAGVPKALHVIVVEESLSALPPVEVLSFLDSVQATCGIYKSKRFLLNCLKSMGRRDPEALSAIMDTLTPELMFDEARGVAIVQVCELFAALDGGDWARYLLDEGSRGVFGGTGEQIDRAAIIGLASKADAQESLNHIGSILDSPHTPGDVGIGQSLIHFLCTPNRGCWPNGDANHAIAMAFRVLEDPRFAYEASAQLIGEFSSAAPKGCEPTVWEELWRTAMLIQESYGR